MSRTQLARFAAGTIIAASLAAFGPAAAASAVAPGTGAHIQTGLRIQTDAASPAALYAGVRQAAVGQEFPVAVVGAAEGSVWEIRLADSADAAGTLTVGPDGTGTTLVRVPVGTAGGTMPVTAVSGAGELSTTVSVAGAPAADGGAPALAADEAADETAATPPIPTLVVAGAGVLVLAGAAVAVPIAIRRRRGQAAA
jgi:hypothetical protein